MMKRRNDKWRIYIVAHKKIYDVQMEKDKKFNNKNYCFLNVGEEEALENSERYCCINQKDLVGGGISGKILG